MATTTDDYRARIWLSDGTDYDFPERTWNDGALPARTANSGVCFSGGGTRAMTAGMGQLRALHALGVLPRVRYISCVSGGSWLSAPFTYYQSGAQNDDEFLGPVTEPENITRNSLATLSESCIGHAATKSLRDALFTKAVTHVPSDRWWLEAVGETFFSPFGLHDSKQEALFSYDDASVAAIRERNTQLADVPFATVRDANHRPYLIVNASMVGPVALSPFTKESVAVFQATPLYQGSPHAMDVTYDTKVSAPNKTFRIGGGFVEPFAFTSNAPAAAPAGGLVTLAKPAQRFSIAAASGLSSSAFAGFVEQKHLLGLLNWSTNLSPEALTWPVTNSGGQPTTNFAYADGGVLENYGLLSLLQRGVENIVVFMNGVTRLNTAYDPARRPPTAKDMDANLPPLFGFDVPSTGRVTWRNQVFAREDFATVVEGLIDKRNKKQPVNTTTELTVQANDWWGIPGGNKVRINWHYLDRVPVWESKLEARIRNAVERGGHEGVPHGPFEGFPHYKTIGENLLELVELTSEQVNLLADLTCWSTMQESNQITELLTT